MTISQIKTELSKIIDSLILDNNPLAIDDLYPELLSNGDERQKAIDQLKEMVENYREIL